MTNPSQSVPLQLCIWQMATFIVEVPPNSPPPHKKNRWRSGEKNWTLFRPSSIFYQSISRWDCGKKREFFLPKRIEEPVTGFVYSEAGSSDSRRSAVSGDNRNGIILRGEGISEWKIQLGRRSDIHKEFWRDKRKPFHRGGFWSNFLGKDCCINEVAGR